jgi:hypothetical protein
MPEEGEGAASAPTPFAPPEEGHVIAMWVHLLLAPKKDASPPLPSKKEKMWWEIDLEV